MKEQRVEAVERALSIIEAFSIERKELTLAEIAKETGLYKSTILRLCGSLERYGYIVRTHTGIYRIGPSLWRLGSLYSRNFELSEAIRPQLKDLVYQTRETASYYVRELNERICLYREVSKEPLRFHLDEGARLPMDRGAAAHILRAFSEPFDGAEQNIRTAGFAESNAERSPQVAAVAVPVFSPNGKLRGALCISGPSFRFDSKAREEAIEKLLISAQTLSKQ